jgi:hypothetical protein
MFPLRHGLETLWRARTTESCVPNAFWVASDEFSAKCVGPECCYWPVEAKIDDKRIQIQEKRQNKIWALESGFFLMIQFIAAMCDK